MRRNLIRITVSGCFFALAVFLWAQMNRKAGLWEVTSTQTWQQSPFPSGMAPPGGGTRVSKICVTQQQIDKYGGIPPQTHGNCQVTNIVKKDNGMTADLECTGPMSGKGTIEETASSDGEHAKGKVHFVGSMQMGPNSKPIEWTNETTSVFKGADCGDVKPINIPDK